jgi:hypothetical protein
VVPHIKNETSFAVPILEVYGANVYLLHGISFPIALGAAQFLSQFVIFSLTIRRKKFRIVASSGFFRHSYTTNRMKVK